MDSEPASASPRLGTESSSPVELTELVAAAPLKPRTGARVLALTVRSPLAPDVPETRLRREPEASVNTLAVTPTADELIAAARPLRLLSDEFSVMVCGVPEAPTCRVMEPVRRVDALETGGRNPLEVSARFPTSTVCVPAIAEEVAAVRVSTFVSELDPVFVAIVPCRSVSELMSFDKLEKRVPSDEIAVS